MKFKFIFLLFFISSCIWAINPECSTLLRLDNPALQSNETFWTDYAILLEKNASEKEVQELMAKHIGRSIEPQITSSSSVTHISQPTIIHINNKAQKEIAHLQQPKAKKALQEFLDIMADQKGILEIRNNPGKWRLERIKAFKNSHEHIYSVRLNGDYRVLFSYEKGELKIMQVNVDDIHNI